MGSGGSLDWLYASTAHGVQPSPDQVPASLSPASQKTDRSAVRKKNPLSCNLCRRRKVKCDKGNPCSHCVRAGEICISPAPSGAPRGRQGGRRKLDRELMDRLAKLENLVKNIEPESSSRSPSVPSLADESKSPQSGPTCQTSTVDSTTATKKPLKEGLDRYLGSSLWMNLSDEIHGLRDVLEQSSDEDDEEEDVTPNSSSHCLPQSGLSTFVIHGPDTLAETGIKHPTRQQELTLYSAFMTGVHFAVSMLHGPSLHRYFVEQSSTLDCSPGQKGLEALRFAVYFTATTSLRPDQCISQLGEKKSVLIQRFRSGVELGLAKIDFVNTEDMSTLQALVFYLFAVRSNENSRRTWTLTSLAIRIAHALELHREHEPSEKYSSVHSPFTREMRRRLWWEILCLDRHGTVDRGSDMIVTMDSFTTPLPLHVNDADLTPGVRGEIYPRQEFTDMTLNLVCHEFFDTERRLNRIAINESVALDGTSDDPWAQRKGWVIDCTKRIEEKYLRYLNPAIPAHRYVKFVNEIMFSCLWLWTYRPLQRHPNWPVSVKVPPPGILYYAVVVMEKNALIYSEANVGPYKWISTIWVQWHALAVMLAELCVQIEGPTVERAWAVADSSFQMISHHIADSEKGRLWRPIRKLMNRANTVRRKHREGLASESNNDVIPPAYPPNPLQFNPQLETPSTSATQSRSTLLDLSGMGQQPQVEIGSVDMSSTPMDWDSWTATTASHAMGSNNELDQMGWTNWESFLDDFQAPGHPSPPDLGKVNLSYEQPMHDYGPMW